MREYGGRRRKENVKGVNGGGDVRGIMRGKNVLMQERATRVRDGE